MVSLEVIGLDTILATLQKFNDGISDLSPAFRDMSDVIIQEFTANFEGQGDVLGYPFAPLAESTLKARQKRWGYYRQDPIATGLTLVWTGNLKSGYESEVDPDQLVIRNTVDYATYQHFGTDRITSRRIVGSSDNIMQIINDRLTAYLKNLLYS